MNIESGIDLGKLVVAGDYICKEIGKESNSKCALAMKKPGS